MDYKLLYQNRDKFKDNFPIWNSLGRLGQLSPDGNPWSSGGLYGDGNTTFVKKLIVLHNIKYIVELGVGEGASTRAMLDALEVTDGQLFGCDITNFSQLPHDNKRFHFLQEAGETFIEKMVDNIDLLHIDTSPHNYVQMHYWMFDSIALNKVKIGGFVILHDMGNSFSDNIWGEDGGDGDKETDAHWTNHRGPVKEMLDFDKDKWNWTFIDSSNRWGALCLQKLKD